MSANPHWRDTRWVFVDIETTGGQPFKDRIIEIALIERLPNGDEKSWQSLINPKISIPFGITRITGITNAMVQDQPYFEDIAQVLLEKLRGAIFVAHNVGFDYNFIRSEFKKIGVSFSQKKFCTVQLSRRLFPDARSHSLDNIINNFNIACNDRHRAMDDIESTLKFFKICENRFDTETFQEAVNKQLKLPELPSHLDYSLIEDIPETVGVYQFYGQNRNLIYVGKSNNLRKRVLSHFSSRYTSKKSQSMVDAIQTIEWILCCGEMDALLQEAVQVKLKSPTYNKKLKGNPNYLTLCLEDSSPQIKVISLEDAFNNPDLTTYGMFKNKKACSTFLDNLKGEQNLCPKLLGLEKTNGPCFSYHLKQCKGACCGEESLKKHHFRILNALQPYKTPKWPLKGILAFSEVHKVTGQKAIHLGHNWKYLGTAKDDIELKNLLTETELLNVDFDYDFFAILRKYIDKPKDIRITRVQ